MQEIIAISFVLCFERVNFVEKQKAVMGGLALFKSSTEQKASFGEET